MSDEGGVLGRRLQATRREGEQVTPLELFFDLVFVLAVTQCTALMAANPSWAGLGQGLLVLAVLWWSWGGYAWLTSVIDPEEGAVRLAMFAAMAAFLVSALCLPESFGRLGLTFAIAYGLLRGAHIALFVLASRDEPDLRRSVTGLAVSTAISLTLLVGASFADGWGQAALWVLALSIDMGGPYLFGSAGWKIEPAHFAERYGLIVLIALGESIVAIGVAAEHGVDAGVITAAVLGLALAAAMWWMYFDVVSLIGEGHLVRAEKGKEQNELARDAYSFLHYPMVAGIVLLAFGLKVALALVADHPGTAVRLVPAAALAGGLALYLLAHVAFRYRVVHTFSRPRLTAAVVALALIPAVHVVRPLVALVLVVALAWSLVAYETVRYAAIRDRVRHQHPEETVDTVARDAVGGEP